MFFHFISMRKDSDINFDKKALMFDFYLAKHVNICILRRFKAIKVFKNLL